MEGLLVDRAFPDVPGEATELASTGDLAVPGPHNVLNALAAAALMAEESVRAVSLRADGLDVQVGDLGSFAVSLPGLARQHDVTLFELSPSDESLESVFAYLVAR